MGCKQLTIQDYFDMRISQVNACDALSKFTQHNEDGLLAETNSSGTYLAMADGNRNIIGYVDSSDGAEVANYEYSPFGKLIVKSGTMADSFNFKFSSYYTDNETGLVYYGYRYYDADMGRWLNRDPLGEVIIEREKLVDGYEQVKEIKFNLLYGFVNNDAVNFWDYLGLQAYLDHPRKVF